MKKCAFLSMENLDNHGFHNDDNLLVPYFKEYGWDVEFVPWNKPGADWSDYQCVIIRSTWDYQFHPLEFISVLETITSSGTRLANPVDIVRWNLNKEYLLDLNLKGIPIPHTIKGNNLTEKRLGELFAELNSDEIIIKPVISANADKTFRIDEVNCVTYKKELLRIFEGREYIAQPFRENILSEGEYSLFFFNNKISHAIKKIPKEGDFRVQENHGGSIISIEPDLQIVNAGENVLNALDKKLLYARVDFVRNNNEFELMELELIEPSLYFRTKECAPLNFVKAFTEWYEQ